MERSGVKKINKENIPSVYVGEFKEAYSTGYLKNHKANLFYNSYGLFAHSDTKAIKKADTNCLFISNIFIQYEIKQNDMIRIKSDGQNIDIEKI